MANDPERLLEAALQMARQELDHLRHARVEEAMALAGERRRLMDEVSPALAQADSASKDRCLLLAQQIDAVHDELASVGLGLKQALGARLKRTRQESKRLAGYGASRRFTPSIRANTYLDKAG